MNTLDRLTALMVAVSEVSVDVKHLLLKHDETSARILRLEDRNNVVHDEHDERLRTLEKMRGKLLGIAFAVPVIVTVVGIFIGSYYG